MGFRGGWSFSLGSRPAFLPSRPYFSVRVLVAVFQSTETSLYLCDLRLCDLRPHEAHPATNNEAPPQRNDQGEDSLVLDRESQLFGRLGPKVSSSHNRVLYFSFDGGAEKCHEMALESVSWADSS